jgi:hypothetical protein
MVLTDPSGHETEVRETCGSVAKPQVGVRVLVEAGRAIGLYETEDGLRLCPVLFLSPNVTLQI